MGAFVSDIQGDKSTIVEELTSPSKGDWITLHSEITGVTMVEVERLWLRFQQMGCDENGILSEETVKNNPKFKDDVFVRNVLVKFADQKGDIHFQTFLNAMEWFEESDIETKLKATFSLFNNGNPIYPEMLERIIKRVYSEDSEASHKRLTQVFMKYIDDKNQGFIDQDMFVRWAATLPKESLEQVMHFSVVPPEINGEAQKAFEGRSRLAKN
ncbi:uncharacterized protein LOC106173230 [Lingula anatina]|uniref:Uncharacterized protein LOC106173230 n=1 Tax=Lingula anatina TaxID=7574 RepID=A0A1S3JH48_LINAN|nr:uncharacterized protein LOC106173230 [Lingula anatina]XP_013409736.1 uncharacterized protein LOC106173230 [Lingula anatina]|eukprot:XP_013409735.1 uncharacterized protein LOC106173230 [Lingula anatina]